MEKNARAMSLRDRLAIIGAFGALHGVLAACGPRDAARVATPAPDLVVSVRAGVVVAPDSVEAGWARVRVEEDGAGHILVVFRLPETSTDADMVAFIAALDTSIATPRPGIALGGPEVGDTGEVLVQLKPGKYVLGCVRRGPDGHRHASAGEAKALLVTVPSLASGLGPAIPQATQEVQLVDFAFTGSNRWRAGSHLLRVENRGQQDHQLRLARLRAGSSLRDWLHADEQGDHAETVSGVARLGPGAVAYLPVELPRGAYVLYCLVADTASGRPHVELGMFRAIQVEK